MSLVRSIWADVASSYVAWRCRRDPGYYRDLVMDLRSRSFNWNDSLFSYGLQGVGGKLAEKVTEPYRQVGLIYIAISTLIESIESVPWGIKVGERDVPDHEAALVIEANGGSQLLGRTVGLMELHGIAYWLLDRDASASSLSRSVPRRIRLVRRNQVEPNIVGGELVGWTMTKTRASLPLERIVRFSKFDPLDDNGGVSSLQPLQPEWELAYKGSLFQVLFYENGAVPPFAIEFPENATPTDDEIDRMKAHIREKILGIKNAGTPLMLFRGGKFTSASVNQREAEWIKTMEQVTNNILAGPGVKPAMVGFMKDANRSNTIEERRQFWGGTVTSRCRGLARGATLQFIERFWPGASLEFDVRARMAEVMPEEQRAAIDSASKMVGNGVPASQAYRIHGVTLDTDGAGHLDVGFLPTSVAPAEMVLAGLTTAGGGLTVEESAGRAPMVMRSSTRSSKPILAGVDDIERAYAVAVSRWVTDLERQYMADVPGIARSNGHPRRDFNPTKEGKELAELSEPHYRRSIKRGMERQAREIRVTAQFDNDDPRVREFIKTRKSKVSTVPKNLHKSLDRIVDDGIERNLSDAEIAANLRARFGLARAASLNIARTEVGSAYSHGRFMELLDAEISRHTWASAGDSEVRPSHQIDGETVDVGELFSNGLPYPQAPGAPPEEAINCRCGTYAVVGRGRARSAVDDRRVVEVAFELMAV